MLKYLIFLSFIITVLAVNPRFPTSWTAQEDVLQVQYQGNYVAYNDSLICKFNSACQVETQYASSMTYFDFENKRIRNDFKDPKSGLAAGSIFADFKDTHKEYQIDNSNTCVQYCPLKGIMYPIGMIANSTDVGPKTIGGKTYEDWQAIQYLFQKKKITNANI